MKKMFMVLCLLIFIPVCALAETDSHTYAHELFAGLSTDQLLEMKNLIEIELECREQSESTSASGIIKNADGSFFLDEDLTRKLICNYFESNGLAIKYVMFQPLVEKDDGGLYGGMERWWVTLENGETFAVWTINGKIEFCYDGEWYYDISIYP